MTDDNNIRGCIALARMANWIALDHRQRGVDNGTVWRRYRDRTMRLARGERETAERRYWAADRTDDDGAAYPDGC